MLCFNLMESYCATGVYMSCRLFIASYSKQNVLVNRKKMPQGTKIKPEGRGFKSRMSNNIFPLKVEEGIHFKNNVLRKKLLGRSWHKALKLLPWPSRKTRKFFLIIQLKLSDFFSGRTEMPSRGSGRTSRSIERTTTTSKDSFPRNQSPIKSFGALSTGPLTIGPPDNLSLVVLR